MAKAATCTHICRRSAHLPGSAIKSQWLAAVWPNLCHMRQDCPCRNCTSAPWQNLSSRHQSQQKHLCTSPAQYYHDGIKTPPASSNRPVTMCSHLVRRGSAAASSQSESCSTLWSRPGWRRDTRHAGSAACPAKAPVGDIRDTDWFKLCRSRAERDLFCPVRKCHGPHRGPKRPGRSCLKGRCRSESDVGPAHAHAGLVATCKPEKLL